MSGTRREHLAACYDVPRHHVRTWAEQAPAMGKTVQTASELGEARAPGFAQGWLPELHHRLYAESPAEIPMDERPRAAAGRAKLHDLASELPELETLRAQTVRDPLWSAMATCAIGESVARALPARPPPNADVAKCVLDGINALREEYPGPGAEAAHGPAERRHEELCEGVEAWTSTLDESAVRTAMRRGIAEAGEAIGQAEAALAALGWGNEPGQTSQTRDAATAIEVARKVRSSPQLGRIMAMAGRLIATARHKRACRAEYDRGEIVGVKPTREISRVLPSELATAGTPLGMANLYRKCLENSALGYETKIKSPKARGPIIVCIDQSGSMTGDKDAWAKGIALALLDMAKAEGRAFAVLTYDHQVKRTLKCFEPREASVRGILDVLSDGPSGGTDFLAPMKEALRWIEVGLSCQLASGRADVILITDGEASTDGAAACEVFAKRLGCTRYGIAIAAPAATLAPWCDHATEIGDVTNDTAAVDLVFDGVLS